MSEQYIRHEPQFCVMICLLCNGSVPKRGIARHYMDHHQDVALQERKAVLKYSKNFDLCEMNKLQYPSMIIPRIEGLAVTQGVWCSYNSCNYACLLPSGMPDHLTPCHGWVPLKGITPMVYISNFMRRSYVDRVWCANTIQRQHTQVLPSLYYAFTQ